jgi:uncharacterized membrane protein YvbJ
MYCPSCGKANPDDSKFCENCGATLNSAAKPAAPAQPLMSRRHKRRRLHAARETSTHRRAARLYAAVILNSGGMGGLDEPLTSATTSS